MRRVGKRSANCFSGNTAGLFKCFGFDLLVSGRYAAAGIMIAVCVMCSCAPRNHAVSVAPAPYAATAVPSQPSDRELNAFYLNSVSELQKLNAEMNAANNLRDFEAVREKALEGVLKARAARRVAAQLRNESQRQERLAALDITIRDLERLVSITSRQ